MTGMAWSGQFDGLIKKWEQLIGVTKGTATTVTVPLLKFYLITRAIFSAVRARFS